MFTHEFKVVTNLKTDSVRYYYNDRRVSEDVYREKETLCDMDKGLKLGRCHVFTLHNLERHYATKYYTAKLYRIN